MGMHARLVSVKCFSGQGQVANVDRGVPVSTRGCPASEIHARALLS